MTTHTQAALDEARDFEALVCRPWLSREDARCLIADKLAAVRAESAGLVEALEAIASCQSNHPGDVVTVASEALAKATRP